MSKQIIRFKDSEDKVVAAVPDGGVLSCFQKTAIRSASSAAM